MSNMIKERTLLTIFVVACGIMLNVDICFIFFNWVNNHLCIWAIWCVLSILFLGYMAFDLIQPYEKRQDPEEIKRRTQGETRRSDKRTKN